MSANSAVSIAERLRIDLHSHSTASDGSLTPAALVESAVAAGLRVLALTDHDNTAGISEARAAAEGRGLLLVPGVEVSVTWNSQVTHIVGLRIDPDNTVLQQGLAGLREFRVWRAEEIGRRLAERGIEGALDGARSFAKGEIVGRTHFARWLVQEGFAPDTRRVFERYLVRGKPGHVPGQWASLQDAVGWIRAAGGQAVVAHPGRYKLSASKMAEFLDAFRQAGGEGIEVLSGSQAFSDAPHFAKLARYFGLKGSAGSDYHGPEQTYLALGRLPLLPEGVPAIWQDWPELELAA
ncbi:PHP domain-containing protein [Thermithiobacillus plumbiphilus]|uniref:PHP domain-containing protein n=1 Tax=Thermithiobacillus plumbiphilus TaxID=1729899 RepID=A0ABU9D6K0_9PROT